MLKGEDQTILCVHSLEGFYNFTLYGRLTVKSVFKGIVTKFWEIIFSCKELDRYRSRLCGQY